MSSSNTRYIAWCTGFGIRRSHKENARAIEKWLIQPGESKVIDLEVVRKLKVSMIGGKIDVPKSD